MDPAPKKAKDVAAGIEAVCPGVFTEDDAVCCAADQLTTLKAQLTAAQGLLKSCPACWSNFARFWCTFTCSPSQKSFVEITQSTVCNASVWPGCEGSASSAQGIAAVQTLNVRVSEKYANGLFSSCKDVTLSSTGEKVMSQVFGGASTAQGFLRFQGATAYNAGQNPININFQLIASPEPNTTASSHSLSLGPPASPPNTSGVMQASVVACDTSDPALACMCTDCAAACPAPPPPYNAVPWWRIPLESGGPPGSLPPLSVNLFVAAAACVLLLVYLTAGLALAAEGPDEARRQSRGRGAATGPTRRETEETQVEEGNVRKRRGEGEEEGGGGGGEGEGEGDGEGEEEGIGGGRTLGASQGGDDGAVEGGGEAPQRTDRRSGASRGSAVNFEWLYRLGRWIGQRPGTLLAAWVCVGAASVIVLRVRPLDVITDPVELWAQEGSRALAEKRFFDAHFGAFWRTEMIIAKRPLPPDHVAGRNASADPRPNTLSFLLRLHALQTQVEGLAVSCEEVREVDPRVQCGLHGNGNGNGSQRFGLESLCYQPVPGAGCLVESVLEFWQMNRTRLEATGGCGAGPGANKTECEGKIRARIDQCARDGAATKACWSRAGLPLPPKVLFGTATRAAPSDSEAFVVTYLLNSDAWTIPRAVAWERKLIALLQSKAANLDLSFSTEASLEAELAKGGEADYLTIAVSYLVMLAYVTCSLGSGGKARPWGLRLLLSVTGVLSVGLSLLVAAAVCALCGVRATLIISEVIPFIVLAIGVDNIFILVWGFDASASSPAPDHDDDDDDDDNRRRRVSFADDAEEAGGERAVCDHCRVVPAVRAGLALERVGPSVISAATAQAAAFTIGSWTGMPAVMSFAVLAAVAVAVDAVIQLTLFLPVLAATDGMFEQDDQGEGLQSSLLHDEAQHTEQDASQQSSSSSGGGSGQSWLHSRWKRGAVLGACSAVVVMALCCSTQVRLGLEQEEALPTGSYLIDYFRDVAALVNVGAPFFLVVRGQAEGPHPDATGGPAKMDFSDPSRIKALCSRPGCDRDSVGNLVGNLARHSDYTFVATGMTNFVDDFLSWLAPAPSDPADGCCRTPVGSAGRSGAVCPAHWTPALHPGVEPPADCACNSTLTFFSPACPTAPAVPCEVPAGCLAPHLPDRWFQRPNKTSGAGQCFSVRIPGCEEGGEYWTCSKQCYRKNGHYLESCMPSELPFPNRTFLSAYFADFMRAETPSDPGKAGGCSVGGEHYASDIANHSLAVLGLHGRPEPASLHADVTSIRAARFMAYHSALVTQEQYIGALHYAYKFVDALRARLQLDVGVHSVFYVFFEQYLTMEASTMQVTGLGLLVVWLVVWAMLGSLRASLLLLSTALAILVVLVGTMGLWGVRLNALSAVNLAASVGIAVEFSVHLVHAFLRARGPPARRAARAFAGVGSAVFSGIAVTKLLGVSVLALAHSRIFVVYYFRMYFALVLAGSLYGLLLLPVLLVAFMGDTKHAGETGDAGGE